MHADKEPEPLNLGVPVVNFSRANAILARAQALLWVRDWKRKGIAASSPGAKGPVDKVKGGWARKIIYLVSAILVAHPLIAARKFVAHP